MGKILVKDAQSQTQYKTTKGRIIEIEPKCHKRSFPLCTRSTSRKYRTDSGMGFIVYGWLPEVYELKEINKKDWVDFKQIKKQIQRRKNDA